jgi:hypothetical protein
MRSILLPAFCTFCLAALLLCQAPAWAEAAAPRPVNPLPTSRLLLEEEEPITAFDLDRGLTQLCRAGRFRQQREHLFIVRLGGYVHGAVIGGYWGLYDPERLAVPRLVYAVRWQDTGRCEVYVLRHLPA